MFLLRQNQKPASPPPATTRPPTALPIRRDQMLERNHPPVGKRHDLVRVGDRRDVRVVERVVERTPEEYEPVAMMRAKHSDAAKSAAESAAPAPSTIGT